MNGPADEPAANAKDERPGYSPYRLGVGVSVLLVLAAIILYLASLTLWADREVFNNKNWTDASTQVIEQPAVQNALADYLVDQLFDSVDVEQEIKQQLPSDWEVLASPATSGLRSLAISGTKKLLTLPITQQAWSAASSTAHETLIGVLEGGNEQVSTEDGVVSINARTILEQASQKLGLSGNLVKKIPESAGTFEIYHSQDLATAQRAYKLATSMKWILALAALAFYVLAIALASQRRRRAVTWMGVSFVVVALLLLITQSFARGPLVDGLAQTTSVEPAVSEVYTIATALLVRMAKSLLVTGLLVTAAATLAGPWRWAVATRRFLAPWLRDQTALAAATAALAYLIVLWLVPISGFRTAAGLALNTLLVISGFIALTLITRREFPDAEPVDLRPAGQWVSRQWSSTRGFVKQKAGEIDLSSLRGSDETTRVVDRRPLEDEPSGLGESDDQPSGFGGSDADQQATLERLKQLHESGALTDAEFATMKKQILSD